jgi:acyl-homoserine lactone acylase PvdQ
LRKLLPLLAVALLALTAAPAAHAQRTDFARQAFSILPPGNFGGLPLNGDSLDQLPLYDGLTPLRENVTRADLRRYFKTARFGGRGRFERTGRRGLSIARDRFGVPHIRGSRRSHVMFGIGWVSAADRTLLLEQGRYPARVSALDVPGIDAFSLITGLRSFTPSRRADRFVRAQERLLQDTAEGRQVLEDIDDYLDGINAYWRKVKHSGKRATRTDVLAAFTFIGSIFGAGGGNEVRSSQLLAALRAQHGTAAGTEIWRDLRSGNDPEAPVTGPGTYRYGTEPGVRAPGSPVVDPDSFVPAEGAGAAAASAPPRRMASNWLLAGPRRSRTGNSLMVAGPQLGYYYPEIVHEIDAHGGGIDVRGIIAPGTGPYVFIGRGKDFAWSLTSAGSDNQDFFLEELCNPDGSAATRASVHYRFRGRCRRMVSFDAGLLKGNATEPDRRLRFNLTVHGPVHGTVTVDGKFYAIAKQRSTRGREALSMLAVKRLNENKIDGPRDFLETANMWEYTFNWGYVDERNIAFFSSGLLPRRATGTDSSLPTLGTGTYEWRGFLRQNEHPQAVNPRSGLLTNWNNKPARGFQSADDQWSYGSVQRVELFKGLERRNRLEDVVGVMNRAATTDLRAVEVWPAIGEMLAKTPAPDATTAQAAALVTAWSGKFASRLDADGDGKVDDPGAAIMDEAFAGLADAVLSPVLGANLERFRAIRGRDVDPPGGFDGGWYGYIDKDLRSLLGKPVSGPFSRRYCGGGDVNACSASLWAALQAAAGRLAAAQGGDPNAWRADASAERIKFTPGLIGNSMRWTNRPTYQQLMEFSGSR